MIRRTVLLIFTLIFLNSFPEASQCSADEIQGLCTKVFDGDTIEVSLIQDSRQKLLTPDSKLQTYTVRLIGVDTPELSHPLKPVQYFSQEASSFTAKMVLGKKVRLEFDLQREDKYGRLLAYVFLPDGKMLNAEIIKQGYGFAYTRFPFRYLDEFRQYERDARMKSLGLWKEGGKAEIKWLLNEKRIPFKVYEMANNLWAVQYQKYVKTRLNDEQLSDVLSKLRVWVHEFSERDLRKILLNDGWEEMD